MAPTLEEHLALHHLIASLPLNFQVASPSLQVASLLPFQQVASTPGPKMASPQGPQVASHPGLPRASPTPGLQVAYYLSPEVAPPDLQVAPPAPDGVSVPPGSCGKQRSRHRRRRRSTSEYGPLGGPRKRAEYGLPCQEAHLRPHNMGSHPLPCPLGGPRQSAECYVSEPCAPPAPNEVSVPPGSCGKQRSRRRISEFTASDQQKLPGNMLSHGNMATSLACPRLPEHTAVNTQSANSKDFISLPSILSQILFLTIVPLSV